MLKKLKLFLLLIMISFLGNKVSADYDKLAYDFKFKDLDGSALNLSEYKGKVVVVVNVASQCGFTNQYEDMQRVWEKYQEKGVVMLGVPSNDFGQQEPGSNQDIMVFLTDAGETGDAPSIAAANVAKENGIRLIAIGVGDAATESQLQLIASEPYEDNVFTNHAGATDSVDLDKIFSQIAQEVVEISVSEGETTEINQFQVQMDATNSAENRLSVGLSRRYSEMRVLVRPSTIGIIDARLFDLNLAPF